MLTNISSEAWDLLFWSFLMPISLPRDMFLEPQIHDTLQSEAGIFGVEGLLHSWFCWATAFQMTFHWSVEQGWEVLKNQFQTALLSKGQHGQALHFNKLSKTPNCLTIASGWLENPSTDFPGFAKPPRLDFLDDCFDVSLPHGIRTKMRDHRHPRPVPVISWLEFQENGLANRQPRSFSFQEMAIIKYRTNRGFWMFRGFRRSWMTQAMSITFTIRQHQWAINIERLDSTLPSDK